MEDPTENPLPAVLEVWADEGSGPIELDGRSASAEEQAQAEAGLTLLTELAARPAEPESCAQDLLDASALALGALEDPQRALELALEALTALPSLRTARAAAQAAILARNDDALALALETEARVRGSETGSAALHLERAAIFAARGDADASAAALDEALAAAPTDLAALIRREATCADAREGEALAEKIAALVGDMALRASYLARAATHARAAGDLDRASTLAERAAATSSASADLVRESLHLETGRFSAYAALRERQIEQGLLRADAGWADIAIVGGILAEDAEELERALSQLPETSDLARFALELRAAQAARDGAHQDVVAFETKRAAMCPQQPGRRATMLGRAARASWLGVGDPQRAAALFSEAIEAGAGPATCQSAASFFSVHGDTEGETRALEALLRVAPSPRVACEARVRLAMHRLRDDPQGAASLLQEALRDAPTDPVPLHLLIVVLRRSGRAAELGALLAAQLASGVEGAARARVLLRHASVLEAEFEDRPGALRALDEALSLAPDTGSQSVEDLLAWGWSELSAERWRQLAQALSPNVEASVAASVAHRRVECLLAEDPLGAEMDELVTQALGAPHSHPLRAIALSRSGGEALAQALGADASACESPAERAVLHCRAATALDAVGRSAEALDQMRLAHELAPGSLEVEEELSWLLLRERRFDELRPLLDGMAQRAPDDVSRWFLLGALCEFESSHASAALAYHQAAERGLDAAHLPLARVLTRCDDAQGAAAIWESTGVVPPAGAAFRCARALLAAGDEGGAAISLSAAMSGDAERVDACLELLRILPSGAARARALRPLRQSVQDASLQVAFLRDLASTIEPLGDDYAALAAYRELLELVPRDPVASLRVQSLLWRRRDRGELVALARRISADSRLEDELRGAAHLLAGTLLEELGAKREAADALEHAVGMEGSARSRWAYLGLIRLYGALDDHALAVDAAHRLAESFPQGREAALCLRWIAARHIEEGRHAEALDSYHAALAADPCDYDSLRAIELLLDPADPQLIDALLRAAAAETDAGRGARLAVTLAHRLTTLGRLAAAAEVLDRALASSPEDLHVLMARAEVALRGAEWPVAAVMLRALVAHPGNAPEVAREARYRLIEVLGEHLGRAEEAERILEGGATDDSTRALELRYRIEIRLDRPEAAARTLEALAKRASIPAQRAEALLALAALRDGQLGDAAGAAAALEEIESADTKTPEVLERLVALATDPRKASEWQRQLVAADPRHIANLHALREMLVSTSDVDGAFCVEAVLVGMNVASDDEAYFYRQRRASLPLTLRGPLPRETLLRIVCPEHDTGVMRLLRALAPLCRRVFAIDWTAMGLDAIGSAPSSELSGVVEELSDALGEETPVVRIVQNASSPLLDQGASTRFLLPARLAEANRRDLAVVCGGLFGRGLLRLGGLDPGSGVETASVGHLQRFVEATLSCLVPRYVPTSSGVVYDDLRDRVLREVENHLTAELQSAAEDFVGTGARVDFEAVSEATAASAARLAVLCARDPGAALHVLLDNPELLSTHASALDLAIDAAVAFAVSEEHAVLRRLLGTNLGRVS